MKIKINWKNTMKSIIHTICIVICSCILATPIAVMFGATGVLTTIDKKIELLDIKYSQYLMQLAKLLNDGLLNIAEIDKEQNKQIEDITKELTNIERKLQSTQGIDIAEVKKITEANLLIQNLTQCCQGSGTHIVINNKSYILSCAHLIEYSTDTILGVLDDGKRIPLSIIKYDKKNDLALFEPKKNIEGVGYLEISKEFPENGSAIIVVGNPDSMTDVITEGVISLAKKDSYIITNLIYFGNSGGAVLYKGKIVGVVTQMRVYYNPPVFVNYGYAVNLYKINKFLEEIK